MGFELRRINPLDLQPRKAVGLFLPFTGPAVFLSTYSTREAIKTNIINYVLTATGERYLNPTFGTLITKQLFENIDQQRLRSIKDQIAEGIRLYFPRVIVNSFSITGDPDDNSLYFNLKYNIKDTNIENEEINIAVER
jgi:phage baseplate assembly protein W